MRIISKFHDYYDCVQATGQDDDLIYVRTRKTIGEGKIILYTQSLRSFQFISSCGVIGFCGEFYPLIKTKEYGEDAPTICYSIEDLDKFIESKAKKKDVEFYYSKEKNRHSWGFRAGCERFLSSLEVDFRRVRKVSYKHKEHIFQDYQVPVFVIKELARNPLTRRYNEIIELNTCLKDLEFYRVVDSYTAFQEIAMFISNQARPENPTVGIGDEDMVKAKGFDKYSFRKDPQT
jgi:hypothetical protein